MTPWRLVHFTELDSTNHHARTQLRELDHADVIQADIQTAGRGRMNRSWVSHIPGNLCLSLVIKPAARDVSELPLANLSQLLAIAVCRTVEQHGVHATLKWPNDIQVGGRKLAGILAETIVEGSDFLGLVLGIGVNLNLSEDALMRIDQPATALNLVSGQAVNVNTFRDHLLDEFFSHYDDFLRSGFPSIRAEYIDCCQFLGREIELHTSQGIQRGVARGISPAGELQFQLADGILQTVTIGEMFLPVPR